MSIVTPSEECPVCLESKECTQLSPCKHAICPDCLHAMLQRQWTCPLCRCDIHGAAPPLATFSTEGAEQLTLTRHDVDDNLGLSLGHPESDDKWTVMHVDPHSFAAAMGFHRGDTILGVNGVPTYCPSVMRPIFRAPTIVVWVQRRSGTPTEIQPQRSMAHRSRFTKLLHRAESMSRHIRALVSR